MIIGRGFEASECKGTMKRASEGGEIEVAGKRACSEGMGTSSDVDEFFALLKRIEETEKQFGVERRVNKGKPSFVSLECPPGGIKQAVVPKPTWRPSFAWEDFCGSGNGNGNGNGTLCAAFNSNNKGNRPENVNNNKDSNCLDQDQDYEGPRERLDLNLPSTLQLFL